METYGEKTGRNKKRVAWTQERNGRKDKIISEMKNKGKGIQVKIY